MVLTLGAIDAKRPGRAGFRAADGGTLLSNCQKRAEAYGEGSNIALLVIQCPTPRKVTIGVFSGREESKRKQE